MSKVDPAKLPLDRRTTLLLSASKARVQHDRGESPDDKEKGGTSDRVEPVGHEDDFEASDYYWRHTRAEDEEPGIDSIRGSVLGLSALGSIYRARRSMRRKSGAVSTGTGGSADMMGVASTSGPPERVGMERLERHRLYDAVRSSSHSLSLSLMFC
jgi:hypothetical protein